MQHAFYEAELSEMSVVHKQIKFSLKKELSTSQKLPGLN